MGVGFRALRWRRTVDRFGPKRLVCLAMSPSSTSAVVLSRRQNSIRWEGSETLPAFDPETEGKELGEALSSMRHLADYASVVSLLKGAYLRLISFPGKASSVEAQEQQVRQTLGVNETYLVRSQRVGEGTHDGKPEHSVLAAALPVLLSKSLSALLSGCHLRPVSLTVGGVTAANLVQFCSGALETGAPRGFLHLGPELSQLILFRGDVLTIIREFEFGHKTISDSLMQNMDLDEDTTGKLLQSGSFDIGSELVPALGPWLHHLVISLDFCERRYGSRIEKLHVFGHGADYRALQAAISEKIDRPVAHWNPLEGIQGLSLPKHPDFSPESFQLAVSEGLRVMGGGS